MPSSQKIDVHVIHQGITYETLGGRPVRRRPEGVSGVVYGGEVYPLRRGKGGHPFIDLTDVAVPKTRCPLFVGSDEPLVFLTEDRAESPTLLPECWAIETNRYGHYVVFDADEAMAELVVDRLDESGMRVRRWDASHRAASDGYFYDWFVRLDFSGTTEECAEAVRSALGSRAVAADPADDVLSDVIQRVQAQEAELESLRRVQELLRTDLEARVEELETALVETEAALVRAKERNEALRGDEVRALAAAAAAEERADALRAELADASLRRAADDLSAERADIVAEWRVRAERAEAKAAEATGERDSMFQEWLAADDELQREKERSTRLHLRLTELSEELRRASIVGSRPAKAMRDDLLRERIWQKIVLHETALEAIHDREEFAKLDALFATLFRLDRGEVPLKKHDDGAPVVYQVDKKINNGVRKAEPMGRVYFVDLEGGRRLVFAHRKHDNEHQDRFVEAIRRKARAYEG